MNQQVVRADVGDRVAIIDRQIFEPRIGGLDDDLGLVAGGAERLGDAEDLVADGVAIAQRRKNLMDARLALSGADGPVLSGVEGLMAAELARPVPPS